MESLNICRPEGRLHKRKEWFMLRMFPSFYKSPLIRRSEARIAKYLGVRGLRKWKAIFSPACHVINLLPLSLPTNVKKIMTYRCIRVTCQLLAPTTHVPHWTTTKVGLNNSGIGISTNLVPPPTLKTCPYHPYPPYICIFKNSWQKARMWPAL